MNPTSGKRNIARNLALFATGLGLWGAVVLLFAAPLALTRRISWPEAVSFGGAFWALWLVFLPAVAWFSLRFPLERRGLIRSVGLHLLACLLIVGTHRATFRAVAWVFPVPQSSEAPGPAPGLKPQSSDTPPPASRRVAPAAPPRRSLDLVGPPSLQAVLLGFRAALDVLAYWSVVGVCMAITQIRSSQERERRAAELQARLTTAQLHALRMQIHPHFLFNALNSITALVYVDPRAADEMLGDLSDLLRRSLDSMETQEIPLAEELDFIEGYVRIEQRRFGDRLRVEQRVPEELRKALVPAFLLQPLVENAIRHGVEPRRGPGRIWIEARREGTDLHLMVQDDGPGLPGPEPGRPQREGIGLANTRARLRGLYGPNQSLSVGVAAPQGCRVEIRLPFHFTSVAVPVTLDEAAS